MSEHDLREGSKPTCPKCGHGEINIRNGKAICDNVWREPWPCSYTGEISEFFQLAAILEENQRLREQLAESDAEDDKNFAGYCRETKAREVAEQENQRLAKELEEIAPRFKAAITAAEVAAEASRNKGLMLERERKHAEAAEAKLVKMRDALLAAKAVIMRDDDDAEIRLEEILGICNEAALAE